MVFTPAGYETQCQGQNLQGGLYGIKLFPQDSSPSAQPAGPSRWWGLRAGSRQALPFVFWPLKSKILPMCKKQSLKMNHIQMQRKRESQQKEDKSLKFYLGETQASFLERPSRWIQELEFRRSSRNAELTFSLAQSHFLHSVMAPVLLYFLHSLCFLGPYRRPINNFIVNLLRSQATSL